MRMYAKPIIMKHLYEAAHNDYIFAFVVVFLKIPFAQRSCIFHLAGTGDR